MDFTKNTNLSIEEISENKTSGNELSVTKTSDSTAEKTFTNNAFSHFVTDTMTILWEPVDSGCRLLRCFGNSPILNVPDMIDGRTVSEMGAYCFSRSRPRFPEKIYKTIFIDIENQETTLESGQAFNQKDFDFSAFGTELDGTFLEEITLPDCATTLHNAAFYNCRKLKKLSVGTAISGIGSDEFMNDSQLEHLIIRGKDSEATGLPLILERIAENITVSFCPNSSSSPESTVFFPEYYEWLDEISPAHIFSRSIHGEGFRMRKSFENGILNYRKYDSCLENALTVESPESLCKIALNRLRWPSRLEGIFREKYENVIKKYMGTAFTLAVKDQDFPMLQFICEHFSPDASDLASAIDQCIEKEWGEGNAFLIEAKHKSFSKKTFDFDLDF